MPESEPRPKIAREPKALSAEYHKARKQLMLWSGILFIWELVGIDLEKAKEAGGNAGAVITAIKSPQAIPWVLLVLVGYFLFKLWIEWRQCEPTRRNVLAARIDFGSAWIVTAIAYALYGYQAVSRIQFADTLQASNKPQSILWGLAAGAFLTDAILRIGRLKRRDVKPIKLILLTKPTLFTFVLSIIPILLIVSMWRRGTLSVAFALTGVVVGCISAYLMGRRLHHPVVVSST